MRPRRAPWNLLLLLAILPAWSRRSGGQEPFPDFDFSLPCAARLVGPPGSQVTFRTRVLLQTEPAGAGAGGGARAWSLSLSATPWAAIVDATTADTDADLVPRGMRHRDGFELTELTSGPGNEGAVSAVILSFGTDVYLPGAGRSALLDLGVQCPIPDAGCRRAVVDFVDGLTGSGQPVRNVITYGQGFGFTRRDDGGEMDNDADGYEACEVACCVRHPFIRGNSNGDLRLNLTDSLVLLEYLFRDGDDPGCLAAADAGGDGAVNISDAVYLLNHLFFGGPPPPAPFPECGADSEQNGFPCLEQKSCA